MVGYWVAVRGFWVRLGAIVIKEVMPLCRDRLSFAMMFGMPILELLLFGYAINTDPHHLPTAMVVADQSRITRTVLSALANTSYMEFEIAEARADVVDPTAWVTCVERITTAGAGDPAVAEVAATNLFVVDGTGWHLVLHHAARRGTRRNGGDDDGHGSHLRRR